METVTLKGKFTGGLTDEEFFWFCQENKDLRIERNNNLEIYIMPPVTSLGANYSGEIFRQLANWSVVSKTGIAFDSSAGFTLPDRSVLSPDACWLSKEKWNSLTIEERDRFAPVCPEFIIEVRSKSDSIEILKRKMQTWIDNGAESAWLIDPLEQTSFLFRQGKTEKIVKGFDQKIEAEGKVKGFVLDLSLVKI